jgi:hypothetical protein
MKIVATQTTRPELLEVTSRPMTEEEKSGLPLVPKSGYRLDIRVKPTNRLGTFQEKVTVKTDHPLREEVQFTVAGRVVGPVTVTPPTGLRLPEVVSSQGGSGSIVLTVRGQESTTFTCPKPPPGVEVGVEALGAEEAPKGTAAGAGGPVRRYRLDVKVKAGTPPGVIDAPLKLESDHPGAAEVEVPIYIRILGQL